MSHLALFGGPKAIPDVLPQYRSIGKEETEAAKGVVESGVLSGFLGVWHDNFYGGPKVREFEAAWCKYFRSRYAISVNSNTSGLIGAIGAIGVAPGDEVIVSPWTMCATATAILVWNAIPVFADIEDRTYNLDPVSIEANITPRTRAIIVSDIQGHAADLDAIMRLADERGLKVIEDAAQAPGALYNGRFVGTVADIGVFSLNYHKHIHTGEGGVCVTDDPELAERLQMIRNHAEAVVAGKGTANLANMIGFNFRMPEVEAAIGIEQLKKLPKILEAKASSAERLTERIQGLTGLSPPVAQPGCTHVYYTYPFLVDSRATGVHRNRIVKALQAEGVPVGGGYLNIHLLPMYQKKIAYGTQGFPWTADFYEGHVSYDKGICPVAEDLHERRLASIDWCGIDTTGGTENQIADAIEKIWAHLPELASDSIGSSDL